MVWQASWEVQIRNARGGWHDMVQGAGLGQKLRRVAQRAHCSSFELHRSGCATQWQQFHSLWGGILSQQGSLAYVLPSNRLEWKPAALGIMAYSLVILSPFSATTSLVMHPIVPYTMQPTK